ncbi:histidinol-phosphate transaminase [Thalassovita sp.]|uniref:histidinol-phosphate transaminase n=1 Tax=Thalassovita sp. TaxID=1979401 RepID=UPI002B277012|nr:histidinol-phosphate transaminase [Thalassovita sp.]
MTKITPQPGIMEIDLYVGGAAHVEGVSDVVKLSSNENPYGPSPSASAAARRASYELHRYPSTDHAELRAAIGEIHDVDPENVICGVGSDEVLQFIAQSYAGPGDEVIYTEHGFSMYPILAHACGATPVKVAEKDRVVDVDAILAACTDKTRIVFIANPANPTGTMIDLDACTRLAEGLPAEALLVLDGAYAEFEADYDGGVSLVERRENVIMTRTFSKIYGLGGLRIGWGYAPRAIIDVLNRVRQPFNLSTVQLATAEAALRDTDFMEKCRTDNERLRCWLATALKDLGVESDPSHTNFILARFANQNEADACDAYLKTQGLIVRKVAGYGLPNCLRITIGDESSCRRVAHAIGQFKRGET